MNDILFLVYSREYRPIAVFDDSELCRQFIIDETPPSLEAGWIGVIIANEVISTTPMWGPWEFVNGFPISS
jgi:hypothetical protein